MIVPEESGEAYKSAPIWKNFFNIISDKTEDGLEESVIDSDFQIHHDGNLLHLSGLDLGKRIELISPSGLTYTSLVTKDSEAFIPLNLIKGKIIVTDFLFYPFVSNL